MTKLTRVPRPDENALARPSDVRRDQNPALVYLARLGSDAGRRTMRATLDKIADAIAPGQTHETFPWAQLRYQHTQAIRAQLAKRLAPATVNKYLSALRGVLEEAWRLGQMSSEDFQRAKDVKGVKNDVLPAGREIQAAEIQALFEACAEDETNAGVRDAAVIAVLYTGGLRRAEVVGLDLEGYDEETGELRVRGKGNKERLVYIPSSARPLISAWLDVRGREDGPLFWPVHRTGKPFERRMTGQAIWNILEKRVAEASAKTLSPHDFRRTFISQLLDRGADIVTAQKMVGHASVTTTARYDRRGEKAKQEAAELIRVPQRRKK